MENFQTRSPEEMLAYGDPGDETANRYRFQWTWAAIVCCMLLDDTEDVQEVFCEHHEDVLLKHHDGSFTGHQVKTRRHDQPVWKASEETILNACARFAVLDSEYPERFRGFYFLTNHPLHSVENGQGLLFVLRSIRDSTTLSNIPSNVTKWIRRVARKADLDEGVVFAAMSKTEANADLPKLRDAVMRLTDAIAQCWAPAADCSHNAVKRAAQAMIEECGRASSLDHEQLLPAYVIANIDGNSDVTGRVNGKRMTLDRVQRTLENGRDSTATLDGEPTLRVEPGAGSTDLLRYKLDAGGFSAVSRNSAEDLRSKIDYLGIKWTKKYGHENGLQRYDHIRSLVLSDAGRSFEATQSHVDNFGPDMREHLRRRFHERRVAGEQLFDASDDHLEGMAFSLTAQCKVVWSHDRPWEVQNGSG